MKATLDISLYPLKDDYRKVIIEFIQKVRSNYDLDMETNGMSTQIFGEYDTLMHIMQQEVKEVLDLYKSVVIIKLAQGERTIENLPIELK